MNQVIAGPAAPRRGFVSLHATKMHVHGRTSHIGAAAAEWLCRKLPVSMKPSAADLAVRPQAAARPPPSPALAAGARTVQAAVTATEDTRPLRLRLSSWLDCAGDRFFLASLRSS